MVILILYLAMRRNSGSTIKIPYGLAGQVGVLSSSRLQISRLYSWQRKRFDGNVVAWEKSLSGAHCFSSFVHFVPGWPQVFVGQFSFVRLVDVGDEFTFPSCSHFQLVSNVLMIALGVAMPVSCKLCRRLSKRRVVFRSNWVFYASVNAKKNQSYFTDDPLCNDGVLERSQRWIVQFVHSSAVFFFIYWASQLQIHEICPEQFVP